MWSKPSGVPNPSSLHCRLPATTNVSNYTRGMQQMRHRVVSHQKNLSPRPPLGVTRPFCLLLGAPAALLSPTLPHIAGILRPRPVALRILISLRSRGSQCAGSESSDLCCAHRTASVLPKDLLLSRSLGGQRGTGCHMSTSAE